MNALSDFENSGHFSPTEKLVLRYAVAMTKTPVEVTDLLFQSLRQVFNERSVPLEVVTDPQGTLSLKVVDCPYGDLPEQDPSICAMEKMLFSELANTPLRLAECRLVSVCR